MTRLSSPLKLLLLLAASCRAQDFTQDPSVISDLCPSATISTAWSSYTECGNSVVNDIWGAAPCANAATSTDFGPEVASCNCDLYQRLVKSCLPNICDSKGLDEFETSTLAAVCAYTTAAEGGPTPTSSNILDGLTTPPTGGRGGPAAPTSTSKGAAHEGVVPVAGGVVMGFAGALAALL
ncbi:hypothetical protein QBC33DRAFT_548788 [Phialemonium atrogriseum]|uniref:Extracellular membrane protein CFEM domain-containing protein n=1 Tax=Phialemonium atrogriseum TaxID=1093897 RepID=A0AAJ0BVK5_9PEZI|nr:uncharacterized protein QBC33DRAFT_548788 [Phialemonium atrogriseum]KAK1763879.1 hypothetical protein QBC33DRAFT_548788 [Phialemonium atrogriseum]